MSAILKFCFGFLIILLIGIFSIHIDFLPGSAMSAQQRLLNKTSATVDSNGSTWANIMLDGQKATLTGEAPDETALKNIRRNIATAAGPGGVVQGGITAIDSTKVTVFDGPPRADPFIWIVELQADQLLLSGYVPSTSARDAVIQLAAMRFGDKEISGDLEVASGSPPEDQWLSAVSVSLQALARMESGGVEANGAKFTANGVAIDEARAATITQLMKSITDGLIGDSVLTIARPPALGLSEIIAETAETEPSGPDLDIEENTTPDSATRCIGQILSIIAETRITFESASVEVSGNSRAALDNLAAALVECKNIAITVTGHTDSSGWTARNRQLSQDRADAVAQYLGANDIEANRITTHGAGESEPLTSNLTRQGRARNRRIEIEISQDGQQ